MIELLYTKTESFLHQNKFELVWLTFMHPSPPHPIPSHPTPPQITKSNTFREKQEVGLFCFVSSRLISILGVVFDQQLSKGALSSSRDFPTAYLDEQTGAEMHLCSCS